MIGPRGPIIPGTRGHDTPRPPSKNDYPMETTNPMDAGDPMDRPEVSNPPVKRSVCRGKRNNPMEEQDDRRRPWGPAKAMATGEGRFFTGCTRL